MRKVKVIVNTLEGEAGRIAFKDVGCANAFIMVVNREALKTNQLNWKIEVELVLQEEDSRKILKLFYKVNENNDDSPIQDELIRSYIQTKNEMQEEKDLQKIKELEELIKKYKSIIRGVPPTK
ncbi:hypothetical protein BC30090_p223 (plasmid) [Bacillus cereus]|uniref:hypothetical protein n=1 Tax=Bacillus cereus TaxID=1396 RepID=UPI000A3033D7|nr:hypothetical protein [Bacillus cereus]HDX9576075.1 hypothetical protein [Bacillus mobilis]MBL3742161.1 hypothetical protein [Bacillus cereus]MBL3864462.1 hypothetical protein [Bacillus cereus]MBL3881381.1 hypothetical protein [Bacillus cereus]SMD66417.1 hypothetical protein BACERE00184_00613 [Bacillus cereus]